MRNLKYADKLYKFNRYLQYTVKENKQLIDSGLLPECSAYKLLEFSLPFLKFLATYINTFGDVEQFQFSITV